MADIFKINNVDYLCEFILTNSKGQKISFTKSSIRSMEIIDNIFEPFLSGEIAIANPYDFIENDFSIMGDGKDQILIKFKPKKGPDKSRTDDDWFEHTFSLMDDGDIVNPMVRSENVKVFKLISSDAIDFLGKSPHGKKYSGSVGNILGGIVQELTGKSCNSSGGDISFENYFPPLTYRYIDLLYFLLNLYCCENGKSRGFLSYNSKNRTYEMKILSDLFKNNKSHTIEAFSVGDLVSTVGFKNPNNPPSGPNTGEYIGQLRNIGYSTPLYGWNSEYFTSSLVFGYNKNSGHFDIRKIDLQDAFSKWKDEYVSPFVAIGGAPIPFLNFTENSKKTFKHYRLPYPIEQSEKLILSEMMNMFIFYNLQLSFSNIGNVSRSSGNFIDIFSPRKDSKILKSDEKILGKWFVTEVRHIFNGDNYINNIFATKTYIGPTANK